MPPKRPAASGEPVVKKKAKGAVAVLSALYGELADRNDGQTKDESRRGARLLMTTLAKIKGVTQHIRKVTVTLSLEKALANDCPEGFVDSMKVMSTFVARLRVNASRLANYIFYEALEGNRPLPVLGESFFAGCLTACRGYPNRADDKMNDYDRAFRRFKDETGVPFLKSPGPISQICVYQGKEMFTAMKNTVVLNYEKRRISILRWAIKKAVHQAADVSEETTKVINEKINRIVKLIARSTPNSLSDMNRADTIDPGEDDGDGEARLASLLEETDMMQHVGVITALYRNETESAPTCDTFQGCIRHLHELQLRHVHADRRAYEAVQQEARDSPRHDGLTDEQWGKLVGQRIRERWKGGPPPGEKTPLPMCHNTSAMIRIDMKALREVCKDPRVQLLANGAFWYRCILDPHSKAANIPCLRSCRNLQYSRYMKNMLRLLKRSVFEKVECPWMVGASFLTDGVQLKLCLETLHADHAPVPGFSDLPKAGYQLGKKKVKLPDLLRRGDGVYKMDNISATTTDLRGVTIKGVDPGMVRIVEAVTARGEDWTRENAAGLMQTTDGITGEDYREQTWATKNEEAETRRRVVNVPYAEALQALKETRRRTCLKSEFVQFCSTSQAVSEALWGELLHVERRKQRFYRFSRVQSAVAKVAEWIAPMRDKGHKQRIVMFGAASFMPKKGCAAAPRKRIVRELALRAVTIMVPEPYTSQTCPGCMRKTETGGGHRTRRCKTVAGSVACPLLLNHTDPHVEYDRDAAGSTNIGLRGVYRITKRESGSYKYKPARAQ